MDSPAHSAGSAQYDVARADSDLMHALSDACTKACNGMATLLYLGFEPNIRAARDAVWTEVLREQLSVEDCEAVALAVSAKGAAPSMSMDRAVFGAVRREDGKVMVTGQWDVASVNFGYKGPGWTTVADRSSVKRNIGRLTMDPVDVPRTMVVVPTPQVIVNNHPPGTSKKVIVRHDADGEISSIDESAA